LVEHDRFRNLIPTFRDHAVVAPGALLNAPSPQYARHRPYDGSSSPERLHTSKVAAVSLSAPPVPVTIKPEALSIPKNRPWNGLSRTSSPVRFFPLRYPQTITLVDVRPASARPTLTASTPSSLSLLASPARTLAICLGVSLTGVASSIRSGRLFTVCAEPHPPTSNRSRTALQGAIAGAYSASFSLHGAETLKTRMQCR